MVVLVAASCVVIAVLITSVVAVLMLVVVAVMMCLTYYFYCFMLFTVDWVHAVRWNCCLTFPDSCPALPNLYP